jgi:hypothetical protein
MQTPRALGGVTTAQILAATMNANALNTCGHLAGAAGVAGDTNVMGAGTIMYFYAPVDNRWLVKIDAIAEGDGSTGEFTTSQG